MLEQPAAYSVAAMLGAGRASHGSIAWDAACEMRLHVLERQTGALRTHTLEKPFFFFHIANTYDQPDGGVALDVCAFDDPQILSALRLERLTRDVVRDDLPPSRLVRLSIPPTMSGHASASLAPLDNLTVTGHFCDLPSVAPSARGKPSYRFVYAIGASRPTVASNRLVKIDVGQSGGDASFEVAGMLPGEPLFVPRPGGTEEDDGVCLAMGTDPDGGTSLYVLDARTMGLLARCRSPVPLPAGFHGEWVDE